MQNALFVHGKSGSKLSTLEAVYITIGKENMTDIFIERYI